MSALLSPPALLPCLAPTASFAQAINAGHDIEWVNRCVDDNRGEPSATPRSRAPTASA